MQEVLQVLYTLYSGSDLASALSGGLHADEAPGRTDRPYGIVTVISETPAYTFDTTHEHLRVQIDLYSKNNGEVLDLATTAKNLFDDCRLSIAGYDFINMERTMARKVRDVDMWRVILEYIIHCEKQ